MSDSDDTDVLLLIPPDLFTVPLSDSDDESYRPSFRTSKSGVVSDLIEHMQSLESRILAIESKDSPNNSLNLSRRLSLDSSMSCSQTLPRTKFSVSQISNLQKTPTKYSQCLSLPSTPSIRHQLYHTNELRYVKSHGNSQNSTSNSNVWNKHDNSKLFSEPVLSQTASQNNSPLHVGNGSSEKEPCSMRLSALNVCENNVYNKPYSSLPVLNSPSLSVGYFTSDLKSINDMNLPEVDKLIHAVETNDKDLTGRNGINNGKKQSIYTDSKRSPTKGNHMTEKDYQDKRKAMESQKLKFGLNGYNTDESVYQTEHGKRKDISDYTLPNDSFSSLDTEKFMADFKSRTPSFRVELNDSKITFGEQTNYNEKETFSRVQHKEVPSSLCQQISEIDIQNYLPNTDFSAESKKEDIHQYLDASLISKITDDLTKHQVTAHAPEVKQNIAITNSRSCPNVFKIPSSVSIQNPLDILVKNTEFSNNGTARNSADQNTVSAASNGEPHNRPQRLLTLSDFWNHDSSKSQEDRLRIKLEEERFRREHCEQLIQDLQKKLLEQQEKVAVAVRVDNEKNVLISQFQVQWKKMKHRLYELESEQENLQKVLKSISEKHQSEIVDCQEQINKYKEELSKTLNLATGYKEKSDSLVKEKVDLLKNHANELESYKSLVQQAENRYDGMKVECQKLLEKNEQTNDTLKAVQQDLNKELLKSSEVRTEMAVIHKALDACEAELTILRQEKGGLQLKLKEEVNKSNILEQAKASLAAALDEAKKAEKAAKIELKALTDQQERLRAELRDVYQKQVDEVVKSKLQEFQTQLDAAESLFQNEIETKQRAIAECAARKIKSIIDKHQLEVNLIEEKHKEEKRLYEIKVAQAVQKAAMLEAQLNSYRKSKNQLVEQLHTMMQKQWQQALLIISGGNGEQLSSFKKISMDKLFDFPSEPNLELMSNHGRTVQSEPLKLESQKSTTSLQNVQVQEHQSESLVTLTSNDETPLTSRKECKSDLKKYIKMILDMQQSREDFLKPKFIPGSPPSSQKDNTGQQSSHKDINTSNEGSSTWQPVSELSIHDTSEYLSVPQKFCLRNDQQKHKPPWK